MYIDCEKHATLLKNLFGSPKLKSALELLKDTWGLK